MDLDKRYLVISRQEVDLASNVPRLHGPEDISVVKVPALLLAGLDNEVSTRLQAITIATKFLLGRWWHRLSYPCFPKNSFIVALDGGWIRVDQSPLVWAEARSVFIERSEAADPILVQLNLTVAIEAS